MGEKSYGGNDGVREHSGNIIKNKPNLNNNMKINEKKKIIMGNKKINQEIQDYKKAGEIAIKIREYAKNLIKPDMLLLEIAQKIEAEIERLEGQSAFPVNLSIDDIAAHYHPALGDETKATGLLKVDIGVHINGFIADTAFSLDLTEDKKHTELIKASEQALENSLKLLKKNSESNLNEIGKTIQKAIEDRGFSPIINLSGHELGQYDVHAGITIPNYANGNTNSLKEGAYAIEPFATTGEGKIYEGGSSNIFAVVNPRNPRGPTARKILEYVFEKYHTLPFSLREIQEKFGAMARLGLKELEQAGIIHNFPQLIEKSHKPVSQAEHSFIKTRDGVIITTNK